MSPFFHYTSILYNLNKFQTCTLHYLINVGVRLFIFEQNSTQNVLIPYHMFINFGKLFQSLLKNEQKPQFLIISIENIHIIFINFSTLYYYSIPYDYSFGLNFPPNMLIPYHTLIRYSRVPTSKIKFPLF